MQTDDKPRTQRLVLTARLKEGARERALELVGSMRRPPETEGFERLSVYLSDCEVVFLAEAPEAELLVRQILDDPVRATDISPWLPLFDGPLHRAAEVYNWSAGEVEAELLRRSEPSAKHRPKSYEPCDESSHARTQACSRDEPRAERRSNP
jgi:hypothetical protein